MKKLNQEILGIFLLFFLTLSDLHTYAQEVTIKDTELRKIHSDLINGDYAIDIFLPKGYHTNSKSYPVVFILDAEYNFGMVSYCTRRLIKDNLIPEVILVGIAYDTTYQWYTNYRQRDYTPTKTQLPHTGGGEIFLDFIQSELIPFIQSEYRITNDRTLVGHSLGGLIGFYALMKDPEIFNRYLLVSPSLWYDNKHLFSMTQELKPNTTPTKVYTSIGALETIQNGQVHDMVSDLEKFVDLINDQMNKNSILRFEVLDNETHRSVFPRAFNNGMRILFED